jgi:hypothetical protein
MNRQEFTEKLEKYFLPHQAEKFADYTEKLHGVARYGALGSMTGFDYVYIRIAEEAEKGYMWLVQYSADIVGERVIMDNLHDFDKLAEDVDNEW